MAIYAINGTIISHERGGQMPDDAWRSSISNGAKNRDYDHYDRCWRIHIMFRFAATADFGQPC